METNIRNFLPIEKLGEGSFASVYKVQRVCDQQIYALKKVGSLSFRYAWDTSPPKLEKTLLTKSDCSLLCTLPTSSSTTRRSSITRSIASVSWWNGPSRATSVGPSTQQKSIKSWLLRCKYGSWPSIFFMVWRLFMTSQFSIGTWSARTFWYLGAYIRSEIWTFQKSIKKAWSSPKLGLPIMPALKFGKTSRMMRSQTFGQSDAFSMRWLVWDLLSLAAAWTTSTETSWEASLALFQRYTPTNLQT